ncbi:mitogen-activated protein kinase phosphatase 1, putative [Plasmodium gallinaceum]|uniref:Mitogen-activated protein kinase phosphatase 1, putative n=1 Tax=Plasmodium gallinaceum TaxID=5849 RepID=A0A1J1H1M7_PLAGA|nr:mitogen-activated protein kinase phosphatase 1, putative [Plasmodium gallinaceum]CRG97443.1 mitogen-activated protein kinase phosphatase 1, putative [Plasmodium gallinaceum]
MIYKSIDFEALKKEVKNEEKNKSGIQFKLINSFYMYNYIQLLPDEGINKSLFIIDIRSDELFKENHIKNSISIKNVSKINEIKNEIKSKKKVKIIFYDNEEIKDLNDYNYILSNYFFNVKADFYFLKGGYKNFEKEYFFLCLNNEDEKEFSQKYIPYFNYPIKICDNIYLGNFVHINNPFVNKFLKIKHIYDFTSSGFVIKDDYELIYYRYDVLKKKLENKNLLKNESINFYNFLDTRMIYDVIYSMVNNVKGESSNEVLNKGKNNNENRENDNQILNLKLKSNEFDINNECESIKKKMEKENILIICNQGIKNQTKEKINSISLIICMCYIIFTKKYNVNLIIAYILKICNNLNINSQTLSFLENFYESLIKSNFNLEYYVLKNQLKNKKINGESNVNNENESLLNIIKSDNFRRLIKKYEINRSFIILANTKEYILSINEKEILDVNIIKEKTAKKENISYKYIMPSILFHICNCKKIDFEEINNLLEITINIINDDQIENSFKMPYFSLIIINLCKIIFFDKIDMNRIKENDLEEKNKNMEYNLFSLIYNNIIICIDYIVNNNQDNSIREEFEITLKIKEENLENKKIDKKIYMMFLSLKYLLASFFYFYVYPTIINLKFFYMDKISCILQKIDKFADYYYSIFKININLFQNKNYIAQMCSYDYLPIYFSDILRPFIIINNYLN